MSITPAHRHMYVNISTQYVTNRLSSHTPLAFLAAKISASVNFLFVAVGSAGFAGPWVFDARYLCKQSKLSVKTTNVLNVSSAKA